MVDLVIGTKTNATAVDQLISEIETLPIADGTLYIGYPLLTTSDESLSLDAILTCPEYGIVIFDLGAPFDDSGDGTVDAWEAVEERQSDLVISLKSKLVKHKELTHRRELAVPIYVVTYVPDRVATEPPSDDIIVASAGSVPEALAKLTGMDSGFLRPLNAAIQQVSTIRPRKKRLSVTRPDSRGAKLKIIEKEIANLDRWQKKAAIECPDGPQRIRGLAGSGKTVVLALKAAYLHAQHPDWNIVVSFQSRSLYRQFKDLIRRFSFEHTGDEPNWQKLRILHAWGSRSDPGVYSEIAAHYGVSPHTFGYGKQRYGWIQALDGVCGELLKSSPPITPIFDAFLLDEAQDFGPAFFQLVFTNLAAPKRFVWAYDELQSLKDASIPGLDELFGTDDDGEPRVKLRNEENQPQQDVLLPVCYRTTPWALVTAHALGLGIYRAEGLIQMFDEMDVWTDIGYETVSGNLSPTSNVTLQRRPAATPHFFSKLLTAEDAVAFHRFDTAEQQALWIADDIKNNLSEEELEPSDIVVVVPDPRTVPSDAGRLIAELRGRNIQAHIVGFSRSLDEFIVADSVAVSGIYRAKGNEAPVVYVMDAHFCYGGWGLIRRRNTLFTAITRSRGWVRVCGLGAEMDALVQEWRVLASNDYRLQFTVPTVEQLNAMRRIHRELTADEEKKLRSSTKSVDEFLGMIERGEMSIEDVPKDIRERMKSIFE